jgi:hypothetical protein
MNLRRFKNAEGSRLLLALVTDTELIRQSPTEFFDKIEDLVNDKTLSEDLGIGLELRPFNDRLEFGKYLVESLSKSMPQEQLHQVTSDKFFWDWMSAYWMKELVDADSRDDLLSKIGESKDAQRWVLIQDKTRFHRHLVSGPYFAYEANQQNISAAMVLFAKSGRNKTGNVLESGELWERIAGKTSLATGQIVLLATLMFYDQESGLLRTNSGNKKTGAQAFSKYFSQIDLNLDYEGMEIEDLFRLLPQHLQHWIPNARKSAKKVLA